jgi:hypothetical protein
VAILGAAGFAVQRIDVSSVRFGVSGSDAAVAHSAIEDVNRDGIPDIVLHFRTRELGIAAGLPRGSSVSLQLTGVTVDGVAIEGTDTVRVTGPGR